MTSNTGLVDLCKAIRAKTGCSLLAAKELAEVLIKHDMSSNVLHKPKEILTPRQWYAGMALQGMLAGGGDSIIRSLAALDEGEKVAGHIKNIADMAGFFADAMIAAGEK